MASVTLKGNPFRISGDLPAVGTAAPDATLTNAGLEDVQISSFQGKKCVLSFFPSLDTPVCAVAARQFNERVGERDDAVVLLISGDLPFAAKRFCEADGLDNVHPMSTMRTTEALEKYGVKIEEGPLRGLSARAVVVPVA